MRYQEFREKLKKFIVFTLTDIRKIEPNFYGPRLHEWQQKGYIKKLRRGYYMFSGTPINEPALFLLANRLYAPSYVSFETALSYYGLIPEGVYAVTSATTRKTAAFKTPLAEFSYRTIKAPLFFGYRLEAYGGERYKIAEIEKVVLDYLYFNPHISQAADFYEWRFNSQEFLARADMPKLRAYTKIFNSPRLADRLKQLLLLMRQAR